MKRKENNAGYWAQVATADGLRLDGFLHDAEGESDLATTRPVALLMHGAGANFYGASLVNRIGTHLVKDGWAVLRANNRGHDGWHVAFRGGKMVYLGSAFERLEESTFDVSAWIEWLDRQKLGPITLVGHSLGAFKSLYAVKELKRSAPDLYRLIDRVVAVSPPALTQAGYEQSEHGPVYRQTCQRCQALLENDQNASPFWATYPFPMLLSAGCYLNKYASGETFHFLEWLDELEKPVYWSFGTQELESHQVLRQSVDLLRDRLPETHDLALTEGADHFFTGYTRKICLEVVQWLRAS